MVFGLSVKAQGPLRETLLGREYRYNRKSPSETNPKGLFALSLKLSAIKLYQRNTSIHKSSQLRSG